MESRTLCARQALPMQVAVQALSGGFHEAFCVIFVFPELPSPNLNSSMNVVRMGQNVSLSCSTKNTSVDITYSLFWGTKYLESKRRRGGAVDFHLRISNANESGPYKCKVNVSNLMKYSQDFNFTMASKCICIQWRLGGQWDSLL